MIGLLNNKFFEYVKHFFVRIYDHSDYITSCNERNDKSCDQYDYSLFYIIMVIWRQTHKSKTIS